MAHESEEILQVRVRLICERLDDTRLNPLELTRRNEVDSHGHTRTKERSRATDDMRDTGVRFEELEAYEEIEEVSARGSNDEVMEEETECGAISLDDISVLVMLTGQLQMMSHGCKVCPRRSSWTSLLRMRMTCLARHQVSRVFIAAERSAIGPPEDLPLN